MRRGRRGKQHFSPNSRRRNEACGRCLTIGHLQRREVTHDVQAHHNGGVDASASIGVVRLSPSNELRVIGGVVGLGSVDLGPVTVGAPLTLRMSWDPANNRVDFQRNNEPVQSVLYTVDDSDPIASPFVLVEAVGFVANCTVGARPTAVVSALFDNIFINP